MAVLLGKLKSGVHQILRLLRDHACCGCSSPAQDDVEQGIDLNDYCIRPPQSGIWCGPVVTA